MFNDIIFWCEFPEEINWVRLNALLKNRSCRIFFASRSRKEFEVYKKKVKVNSVSVGVWPTLSLSDGYWFSSFTSKKNIDYLKEFSGIPLKIDIEPPFPGKEYTHAKALIWGINHMLLKNGHNSKELELMIKELSRNGEVIISGFALPDFIRKRYGDPVSLNLKRNFICYSTFFPFSWVFFQLFLRSRSSKDTYVAIGLTNSGVFGNEPEYNSVDEFAYDVRKAKSIGVKNLVVYSIEGILKRNDADEWLRIIFE